MRTGLLAMLMGVLAVVTVLVAACENGEEAAPATVPAIGAGTFDTPPAGPPTKAVPPPTDTAAAPPTSTAEPPPTPTPSPAETSAPTCVSETTAYRNDQFGFEFQYCSECTLTERSEGGDVYLTLIVGGQLELHVSDSGGLSLTDYVSQATSQLEAGGASIESVVQAAPVDGAEAVTVQYRFGGLGRYGEATFFERNGRVYDVGFRAGAFTCNEPQVYAGILSTFRFAE